jgi:hypothetical protein
VSHLHHVAVEGPSADGHVRDKACRPRQTRGQQRASASVAARCLAPVTVWESGRGPPSVAAPASDTAVPITKRLVSQQVSMASGAHVRTERSVRGAGRYAQEQRVQRDEEAQPVPRVAAANGVLDLQRVQPIHFRYLLAQHEAQHAGAREHDSDAPAALRWAPCRGGLHRRTRPVASLPRRSTPPSQPPASEPRALHVQRRRAIASGHERTARTSAVMGVSGTRVAGVPTPGVATIMSACGTREPDA